MLSSTLTKALNQQVQREFYSAGLYLSMSSWAADQGYGNTAAWLEEQAKEELEHGMKFFHYIQDRNSSAVVPSVEQPEGKFESMEDVFTKVYEHEQQVTKWICEIADAAMKEKDLVTWNWIQWAIEEQIEEEKQASEMLTKVKMSGKNLMMFDHHVSR